MKETNEELRDLLDFTLSKIVEPESPMRHIRVCACGPVENRASSVSVMVSGYFQCYTVFSEPVVMILTYKELRAWWRRGMEYFLEALEKRLEEMVSVIDEEAERMNWVNYEVSEVT